MSFEPDLLEFLRAHVPTVWALEQLSLMRRTSERSWTSEELVRELRSSQAIVTANLVQFERAGLLVREGDQVWWRPASSTIVDLVDRILTLYRDRPTTVTRAIVSRYDTLQQLADAFTFKPPRKP